jgi:sulfur carrier protein
MQVTINGEPRQIPDGLTVRGLLEHLDLAHGAVAVERNREVLRRDDHARVRVESGDVLEIVHFVGGG